MIYCANCDTEATHVVMSTHTPLCYTCATAYEWGQASPEARVADLNYLEDHEIDELTEAGFLEEENDET